MKTPIPIGPLFCALTLSVPLWTSCSGGTSGASQRDNRGDFQVLEISTGRGQLYPYRIRRVDGLGNPTNTIVNIEDEDTLRAHASASNGVLPLATWDTSAVLPDGSAGNHFLMVRFSHDLEVDSILSPLLANQTNSGLTTAVSVIAYDPATEDTVTVPGRGFVGGFTYVNRSGQLELVRAVEQAGEGVNVLDPAGNGFPRGFSGDAELVGEKVFVFVADSDGDLSTFETFPRDRLIRVVVTNSVLDRRGGVLEREVRVASTVGADAAPPQVLGYTPQRNPEIVPGNGMSGVDPATDVVVRFNKPVQPLDVGSFFDRRDLTPPAGGVALRVTIAARTFDVPYYADPLTFADLTSYRIRPAYQLPGDAEIRVSVDNSVIRGLGGMLLGSSVSTSFRTGSGTGIVNAPVAPEAIYLGLGGSEPGIAVVDMNGFGAGTGDINDTRLPSNKNIGVPGVQPPLQPGTSNLDAGSPGVLRLVKDTSGNTRLLRPPIVGGVAGIQIGNPLDMVFNNENINPNAGAANQMNPITAFRQTGNSITVAPHPNPPPLVFPPPNPSRAIFGQEPIVTTSAPAPTNAIRTNSPPCASSPINQMVRGNPLSNDPGELGIYGNLIEGVFYGPQPPPQSPPPPPPFCPFSSRQQVGHFLYVLDRDNRRVLVVNSNRFTVLDTIRMSDPVSMTMSPNLRLLAVTNFASSSVVFIDIDPFSASFHQIVGETRVERGPTGIAWQPDGEDILVVSPGANALTILSGRDLSQRRVVTGFLSEPIEVAVTERQVVNSFQSGVYYAYILNANGTVAVFESGPDGVNGIGFDDVIGTVGGAVFPRASTIRLDYTSGSGGVLIAHVDDHGLGQISRLELTTSPSLPQPLNPNSGGFILPPTFRQKEWTVTQRFGGRDANTPIRDLLSGNAPVDVAMDEMINLGAAPGQQTQFTGSLALPPGGHSGKGALKNTPNGLARPITPRFLFVALRDAGKVDVLEVDTGQKVASIDAPGIEVLGTYWRQ